MTVLPNIIPITTLTTTTTLITLLLLQSLTPTSATNNIASGSSARLPASLSSVINDLEAEGANRITTTAFLSSHGVTKKSRATLLRTLFGVTSGDDDDGDDVVDGVTTAFGKKMGYDVDGDDSEEEEDSEEDGPESVGIAIANPLADASVIEVAATVHACGGNVVYVASLDDLTRGEGLFDKLAPAIERILNEPIDDDTPPTSVESSTTTDGTSTVEPPSRTLVVVVEGATTQRQLIDAKSQFETAATEVLASIVQPNPLSRATTLQQVFDNVEYVSSNEPVDEILADVASSYDPSTAAANVGKATFLVASPNVPNLETPLDLAAARKLLPLSHRTLERCRSTIHSATSTDEEEDTRLTLDFGAISDAVVSNALAQFDETAGPLFLTTSPIGRHIRSDLRDELYAELESRYVQQLELLYLASKEAFQTSLGKLRLSPNLDTDMQNAAAKVIIKFRETVGGLRSQSTYAKGWPKADALVGKLKRELREYVALRIRTALADGKFKPIPRKGITLGFHWLLPKPFGNDYRLEPWQAHTKDSVVYIPKDKITDVGKDEVGTGDWRKGVVPCPTANEMMYLK